MKVVVVNDTFLKIYKQKALLFCSFIYGDSQNQSDVIAYCNYLELIYLQLFVEIKYLHTVSP